MTHSLYPSPVDLFPSMARPAPARPDVAELCAASPGPSSSRWSPWCCSSGPSFCWPALGGDLPPPPRPSQQSRVHGDGPRGPAGDSLWSIAERVPRRRRDRPVRRGADRPQRRTVDPDRAGDPPAVTRRPVAAPRGSPLVNACSGYRAGRAMPGCHADDTKVVDSRVAEEATAIRRRRQCLSCAHRFTTFERVDQVPLIVVKSHGGREPFDRTKIVSGIAAATTGRSVAADQLDALALPVEDRLGLQGSEVSSAQVGLAVLEELRTLDEVAYLRFASVYKDFDVAVRLPPRARAAAQVSRRRPASVATAEHERLVVDQRAGRARTGGRESAPPTASRRSGTTRRRSGDIVTLISSIRSAANSAPLRRRATLGVDEPRRRRTPSPSARSAAARSTASSPARTVSIPARDRGASRGDQEAGAGGEQRRGRASTRADCGDHADALAGLRAAGRTPRPVTVPAPTMMTSASERRREHTAVSFAFDRPRGGAVDDGRAVDRRHHAQPDPRVDPFASRAAPRTPRRSTSRA